MICEGNQATLQFKQTVSFFQPLFKSLKRKTVLPEMVAGLDMIVEDIKQRNYLHAYDIYMRLAIGERPSLPWARCHPPTTSKANQGMECMRKDSDVGSMCQHE